MSNLAILLSGVNMELHAVKSMIGQLERSIAVDKFFYSVKKLKVIQTVIAIFLAVAFVLLIPLAYPPVVEVYQSVSLGGKVTKVRTADGRLSSDPAIIAQVLKGSYDPPIWVE